MSKQEKEPTQEQPMRFCNDCAARGFDWYYQEQTCFLKFRIPANHVRPEACKKKPHSDREMFALKNKMEAKS